MRGDLWAAATSAPPLVGWLEVTADALAAAPTVTVAAVTAQPPALDIGWPLAIAIPAMPDDADPWWVRTTQLHTLARADLGDPIRRLPAPLRRRVNSALATVLDLPH